MFCISQFSHHSFSCCYPATHDNHHLLCSAFPCFPFYIVLLHLCIPSKYIFSFSYLKLYKKGILLCIIFGDFFALDILLRFIHFACRYSAFWLCVNIPMCEYSTMYSSTLSWMGIWVVPAVCACEQCSSALCMTSRAHAQKCWSNSYAVVQRWRGIVKLGSNTSSMFFDDVFPFL